MIQISRSSYKPIYLQICDLIREKIDSGEITVGSKVWSENEIMDTFDVSRNTARKAIETLAIDGIVSRVQGKGSFVRQPKVESGLQYLKSFSEEILVKGMKPTSKVLYFERVHPDFFHAKNLKISVDDWVFKLERVRMADGDSIAYQTEFIPENLCPGLGKYNFSKNSLYDAIEKDYGHVLSWQKTTVKPIVADERIAKILGIPLKIPLLQTESVSYLAGGTPIESNINIYLSDRYDFTVLSHRHDHAERINKE